MSITKKTVNTLIASAFIATMATAAITSTASAMEKGKEKCYGVVQAGQNGCGDANGKHSCQGMATEDGSGAEWLALPAGVCDKLVGGSVEPIKDMPKAVEEKSAE